MDAKTGANIKTGKLSVGDKSWSFPIYSGGLGVLAGDHIKSASDLDIPLVGVGLFIGFALFFEGVLGLTTGRSLFDEPLLPALLVITGIAVIGYGLFAGRRQRA